MNNPVTEKDEHKWLDLNFSQKQWHYKEWRRKHIGQRKYCEQNELPIASFREWCKEYYQESKSQGEGFCELKLPSMTNIESRVGDVTLTLCFPNETKAELRAGTLQISAILKELIHATTILR